MTTPDKDVPELSGSQVCWVTVDEMVEVDRVMVDGLGVSLPQTVENAGRNLAVLARHQLGGSATGRRVRVLAGIGGNRGGGLAAARDLLVAGADLATTLLRPPREGSATADQLATLQRLDVPARADGVVDGDEAPPPPRPAAGLRPARRPRRGHRRTHPPHRRPASVLNSNRPMRSVGS